MLILNIKQVKSLTVKIDFLQVGIFFFGFGQLEIGNTRQRISKVLFLCENINQIAKEKLLQEEMF